MNEITVLFTACSGWPTHANIGSLNKSENYKYNIIGVDCSPNEAALNYVDILYKVPKANEPAYIDELLRLCKKYSVEVIVPLISEEIMPVWNHIDDFKEIGTNVLLPGKESLIETANNKMKLNEFLNMNGLDYMPKTAKLDMDALESVLTDFGYPDMPIVLKIEDACGGIGFKILDENKAKMVNGMSSREARVNPYISKEQLYKMPEDLLNRYMIQEYLPGRELGTLCLVDHGRTIYAVSHDNYEMQYATTTYCELVDNEEAREIVTNINGILNLDGNVGYDFKRDVDGRLRLMEINPRVSATVSLAAKAGLNLLELGILRALGLPIKEDIVPLYGMKLQRVYGTLYTYKGVPYGY